MFYKPRLPKDYIEERKRESLQTLSKDQFSRRFLNEQEALDDFDRQKKQILGIKK